MLVWTDTKRQTELLFSPFSDGRFLLLDLVLIISVLWSCLIFFAIPWLFQTFLPFSLLSFLPCHPKYTPPLQLGLWSRQCPRLSSRGTPLSCTATWLVTQLQKSSGGTPRSTELTPSSSYGTAPASAGYPSTQPTAPMGSVCWASHGSRWRTLEPMSVGPATTLGAMTSDKTPPSPGSVPRPPFQSYRVSGLCPVVPRRWSTSPLSQSLQPVNAPQVLLLKSGQEKWKSIM